MFRAPLALCVALLLSPLPIFAQSGRTPRKQQDRVAQLLQTASPGSHLRLKLTNGEKLEGNLIQMAPESILLSLESRGHASSQRLIDIKNIHEMKTGYGFGTRFKQRMQTIAFFAVIIPAFTIEALLGKHPCLGLCD